MLILNIKGENMAVLKSKVIAAAKEFQATTVATGKMPVVSSTSRMAAAKKAAIEAPDAPVAKPRRGRPKKAAKADTTPVVESMASETQAEVDAKAAKELVADAPDLPVEPEVTLGEVKSVLTKLIKAKGVVEAQELLKKFKANKVSEVAPENYKKLYDKASAVIA